MVCLLFPTTDEEASFIATVLWGIWYARNSNVWDQRVLSPTVAMEGSKRQVSDWKEVMSRKHASRSNDNDGQQEHMQKWMPPVEGTLKLNVDAYVIQGSTSFRIGMVLRDFRGHFIQGKCMHYVGEVTALEAETFGICEALSWMLARSGQSVQIESDSLVAVNSICILQ
ncbi:hypothetical protein AgCh_001852 [Apium graveolens]